MYELHTIKTITQLEKNTLQNKLDFLYIYIKIKPITHRKKYQHKAKMTSII